MKMMIESDVESTLRRYLKNQGWDIKGVGKKRGEHGVDVDASHKQNRKRLLIEVKGDSEKKSNQSFHNAFYTLLGQCLWRMSIQGNGSNKSRIYAVAIPYTWRERFREKVQKMPYGWKLLKLKVYWVGPGKKVTVENYRSLLR